MCLHVCFSDEQFKNAPPILPNLNSPNRQLNRIPIFERPTSLVPIVNENEPILSDDEIEALHCKLPNNPGIRYSSVYNMRQEIVSKQMKPLKVKEYKIYI